MPWLSDNPMWEAFGTRALMLATYGGADFGECRRTVERVGDGDADLWHSEWTDLAAGLVALADASAEAGHRVGAREAYLRAAAYFRTAYQPLFGASADDRLKDAFARESRAFAAAAPLWDMPVELVEIPFENGATLPGVFVAVDDSGRPRPTIVHVNGYDSNVHEMFVAHALAAVPRGYNMLLFDGPGQGRNLIRDGLTMRPDWENVVRPVIDHVLERADVDPDQVVLAGWSWGGFLAPRAAAFEPRLAALWADPGLWDQRDRIPVAEEQRASFPEGADPAPFAAIEESLRAPDGNVMLRWRLLARGLWVHGVDTLFDYFAELARFELSPVAADITCPALITALEGDMASADAPKLLDAISADRKTLITFSEDEGAGGHCEAEGRRRFHHVCYNWLDETLGVTTSGR